MSSTGAKRLVRKDHQVLNQSSYNWHQTLRCAATSCQFQSSQRLGLIIISNEPIKKPQQTRVANTHPTFKQTRFTPRAASFNRQLLFDFKLSLFLRNFNYASTSLDFTRKYSLLRCLFVTFFWLTWEFCAEAEEEEDSAGWAKEDWDREDVGTVSVATSFQALLEVAEVPRAASRLVPPRRKHKLLVKGIMSSFRVVLPDYPTFHHTPENPPARFHNRSNVSSAPCS